MAWVAAPYPIDGSDQAWLEPAMLIVGENGNIDDAIKCLLASLYEPMARGAIATLFVHETMREAFIEKVRDEMPLSHVKVSRHKLYKKALDRIECLNAERVTMLQPDDIGFRYSMVEGSPLIVCDFSHRYFCVGHPSAVVTLHTFRTNRELVELAAMENIPFLTATVWCPKMSAAYELAMLANVPAVFINCHDVPLAPIINAYHTQQPFTVLTGNHHYENIVLNNQSRIFIFPAPALEQSP